MTNFKSNFWFIVNKNSEFIPFFANLCFQDIIEIPLNNKLDSKHIQDWRFNFPNLEIKQLSAYYISFD